jgi:hypothetical protein
VAGAHYVMGGRTSNSSAYSDAILRYVAGDAAPTQVGTLPLVAGSETGGRQEAAAAAIDGEILLFGGAVIVLADLGGGGPTPVPKSIPDIVVIDPATGAARTTLDVLPQGEWGMGAATVGHIVYLFGGFSFDVTNTTTIVRHDWIVAYDAWLPEGTRVSTLAGHLPFPVQDAAAAFDGQRVDIFGGLQDSVHGGPYQCPNITMVDPRTGEPHEVEPSTCRTDAVVAFDPASGTATAVATRLPARMQFASAARAGASVLVLGGLLSDNNVTDAVLAYDPASLTFTQVATLPSPSFAAPVSLDAIGLLRFGGRGPQLSDLSDEIVLIPAAPPAGAPCAPASLSATPRPGRIELAWTEPACAGDSPITSYRAYRVGGSNETLVGDVASLSLVDAHVTPGVTYGYHVVAVNAQGEGDAAFAAARALAPPSAPRALVAVGQHDVPLTTQRVTLTWDAPADDGGAGVQAYFVSRIDALGHGGSLGHTTGRHFVDEHPPLAGDVTYTVMAANVMGEGPAASATMSPLRDALGG